MKRTYALPAVVAAAALVLTGCVNNEDGGDTKVTVDHKVDKAAAAAVPKEIRDRGTLVVGTDAAYPPNEYKDSSGKPIGWNVTLAEALAGRLDLKIEWKISQFDSIIPNITGGKFDMGSSSFTDTVERQKSVDFVDYYDAGSLWAQPKGGSVDPEKACGLKVGVQTGTVQDTDELPERNKKCAAAGEKAIEVVKFDAQEDVTNALVLGKVDAMSADSPVTLDAIKKTNGKIEQAGELFDAAPYGFIVKKGSKLGKAIELALNSMHKDGSYEKILKKAGVEVGAVDEIKVNSVTE